MVSRDTIKEHEEGRKKAMNIRKTSEVLQGSDEHPNQFYEHL
jgi:hypothetical protein